MAGADESLVSAPAVAALLDMSTQHVRELTKDGILTAVKKGDRLRYDPRVVTPQYVRYIRARLDAKSSSETAAQTEERRRIAEADWKRSRADIAELQLKELEGKMHRSEDVAAITADIVLSIRSLLVTLPGRLAMDVAAAGSSAEVSQIIRTEINRILDQMTGYRYDPEQYAQRVRDRIGWEAGDGTAEDIEDE